LFAGSLYGPEAAPHQLKSAFTFVPGARKAEIPNALSKMLL
jgi:hypothetical protein